MTSPSLHGLPRHPYYIATPDYRETSSGVCVLHYLCHALNLAGYEAYVTPCQVNPKLRTPILTDELRRHHLSTGLVPIAVYSEVMDGNPIGTPIVARYILNREGFLTGRAINAQKSDLFFYYTQDFRGTSKSDNLLLLPVIDSQLFSPPTEPVQRSGNYLYLHRFDKSKVDYSLLPDDIEVLSLANPKTLTQLAQIFRTASTLYSYEISATCTEAMLCGCPVIYMPGGHVKTQPFIEQFGDAGSALHGEPGGLERARATVMQARRRWLDIENAFWPQLERFLDITQQAAIQRVTDTHIPSVKDWLRNRVLTPIQQRLVDQHRQQLSGQTSLTLLILDPHGDMNALSDTLASVALWQSHSSIRLRMTVLSISPGPANPPGSLRWLTCEKPGAIELNESLRTDDSDWVMLLTAGEEFLPGGTLMLDLELPGANGCRMIYCDGMYRSAAGPNPVFRPCINLDYLLSLPLATANHWLIRRELALQVGGYDPHVPAALELDLILRLIETDGMNGIAHLSEPLVVSDIPNLADNPDELHALQRHLSNRGYMNARVLQEPKRHYHIKYGHDHQPLVSILIPTRDQLPLLQRCVESVLSMTRYPHFEIILIDNCSQTEETLSWLSEMDSIGGDTIRVIRYPYPFNFSAMNNLAASQARGEYLVLLNNDTAVIREDWLDELLNHALRPEVGIVGAKLVTATGTLQQAGLITGLRGPASSPFIGQAASGGGYLQRLQVDQNTSAVSAACLMIRTSIYLEAGGMDDVLFQVTCNDLDLCLKVTNLGYLNVWTPHAVLLHEGGATWSSVGENEPGKQRFAMEQEQALSKWLGVLANDPAYNSNLSLRGGGFELEAINELTWRPLSWRPLPVVLAHPAKSTLAANLRVIEPFTALRDAGRIEGCVSNSLLPATTLERYSPDVIIFQHQPDPLRLEQMQRISILSKAFKVLELDTLTPGNPEWLTSVQQAASLVDRIIVPTSVMAEACTGLHPDIRVLETRLGNKWRNLPDRRPAPDIPRIGCAIDPAQPFVQPLILELMQALAGQVEWLFWGEVPAYLRPLASEVHADVHEPEMMASLNLDIVLAPQGFGHTDESTHLLHLLQYGACGYSVIGSDTADYPVDLAITRVANSREHWLKAINEHLVDRPASRQQGARLREQVLNNWTFDDAYAARWVQGWLPD
ncbi:glycosyltransferase family 2 protein [Pseudomonas sp. C3-2018]|uniref:glycosyltransferase family 2 protein n=1 Tax=Pseudomonas sp. C3-2018 TaxID=2898587 RepID=UPI001E5211B0|nr:glycosyltransferase family 2 protein [Pseudomonas sp. C3-2018]MCD4530989.1 glycosyltransferase family 2 protein [Pseudomonas sp. C3-2018]